MDEGFEPIDQAIHRVYKDFPPFVPRDPERPGDAYHPVTHQAVKNLIAVQQKLGPRFGHAEAARYYRRLAAHDAESADFYERQARVHDGLMRQKAEANAAAEAAKAQRQEFADMRETAERELDDWCREQGLGPKALDIDNDQPDDDQPPDESQGGQPDSGQDGQGQGGQPQDGQDAQPVQDAHRQGGQLQGGQGQDGQGCQIQGCQPDPAQGCQPDSGQPQGGQAYEWLTTALANGPRVQSELMTEAQAAGVSERSLRRAKAALGVKSFRQGKPCYWTLPAVSDVMPPGADPPGEPDTPPPPIATNAESGPRPPEATSQPCFQCGKPMKPLDGPVSGWECINCDGSGNGAWTG